MFDQASGTDNILATLRGAIEGHYGKNQQRLALMAVNLGTTLVRKNSSYGGAIWRPPILLPKQTARERVLSRMSDKIERMVNLLQDREGQAPGFTEESFDETVFDLAGYCLLLLASPPAEDGQC